MRIPKHIRKKMHRLARICRDADRIAGELTLYFDEEGFDTDDLWEGRDLCLSELEQGNDVTDEFCRSIEAECAQQPLSAV